MRTKPFPHQKKLFESTKDSKSFGLFWEPGVGKTKPTIDTAFNLYEKQEIDSLVVVAPNGVHSNWVRDQLPIHEWEGFNTLKLEWISSKSGQVGFKKQLEKLIKFDGFSILAISYEGLMTVAGKKYLKRFLVRRRAMYVLDEAHFIKSPKVKRTKTILASSRYAKYKRILTGTPINNSPFDIYTQVKFLDENIWKRIGLSTYTEFKNYFGVWFTRSEAQREIGYDPGYDQLIEYRNMDQLRSIIQGVGSRLTKEEAGLNLPPKLYTTVYFEMSQKNKRLYDELQEEYFFELESGEIVEAELALTRLLRLQQITCGYVGTDSEEPVTRLEGANKRIELLGKITSSLPHKAVIWARFNEDVNQIMELLGDKAVRYDGQVDSEQRVVNSGLFKDPESPVQFMVAKPQVGATGLTWTVAKTVIYYNNSFSMVDRVQSEDRVHRIGQKNPVNYIDIVASGTVDEKISKALQEKKNIADILLKKD